MDSLWKDHIKIRQNKESEGPQNSAGCIGVVIRSLTDEIVNKYVVTLAK